MFLMFHHKPTAKLLLFFDICKKKQKKALK